MESHHQRCTSASWFYRLRLLWTRTSILLAGERWIQKSCDCFEFIRNPHLEEKNQWFSLPDAKKEKFLSSWVKEGNDTIHAKCWKNNNTNYSTKTLEYLFYLPWLNINLIFFFQGVIFVNDFNLGRYWPSIGSQVTLFVPKCHLRPNPQKNTIIVFETEYTPPNREIVFTDKPILDKIPPTRSTGRKMTIDFAAKSRSVKYNFKLDVYISRIK